MLNTKNTVPHQKHAALARADRGAFGRYELSIVGTSCTTVKKLATQLGKLITEKYQVAYVDAVNTAQNNSNQRNSTVPSDIDLVHIQTESAHTFNFSGGADSYQLTSIFNEADLVLLNGNHFDAKNQITVIDPREPVKPEDLNNTQILVLQEGATRVPDYVTKHIEDIDQIPVFRMGETGKITSCIEQLLDEVTPRLTGLALAGGKSTRMHIDKTRINYHGKPQRLHLYELLEGYCEQVFISCRKEQRSGIPENYQAITDSFLDMGPLGALLSAFREHPDSAFLAVACDLPLLSPKSLQTLTENRNPSKIATAFINSNSGYPEPLITIWEPKSYRVLLAFLAMGYSCPRKALINADVQLLDSPDSQELMNANNPREYEQALARLTRTSHN